MPRRRPPVEIFTNPVPKDLSAAHAQCPACGGTGEPYGWVVERLVFRCTGCGVRFKSLPGTRGSPAAAQYLTNRTAWAEG